MVIHQTNNEKKLGQLHRLHGHLLSLKQVQYERETVGKVILFVTRSVEHSHHYPQRKIPVEPPHVHKSYTKGVAGHAPDASMLHVAIYFEVAS